MSNISSYSNYYYHDIGPMLLSHNDNRMGRTKEPTVVPTDLGVFMHYFKMVTANHTVKPKSANFTPQTFAVL